MKTPLRWAGIGILCVVTLAAGQTPPTSPRAPAAPPLLAPTAGAGGTFADKPWDQLSDKDLADWGKAAMANSKWRHGETEHFVIHYQKLAEAQRGAREAEAYYQYLKTDFGLEKDYRKGKNHLFIFAKDDDWSAFCSAIKKGRIVSISKDREMFLHARSSDENFSKNLGFPVTCCTLYRFFPKHLPYWVLIGASFFEEGNAYKKMKGISGGERGSGRSGAGLYPLDELLRATGYPNDEKEKRDYGRTCERLVRFLLTKLDRQRFAPLAMKLGDGVKFEKAILEIHPDKFKTYQDFLLAFSRSE